MGLYLTPLLQHTYNIPINPRIHKYYISIKYTHDTYMTPGNIYRMRTYCHNTTRVIIHIACICKKKGVALFITRTRFYTSACIYLYFIYETFKRKQNELLETLEISYDVLISFIYSCMVPRYIRELCFR